jgi:6,7-dimethyl-8-ribityllumazine synthase
MGDKLPIFEIEGDMLDQADKPHILIIEAPFYKDICAELLKGAVKVLDENKVPFRSVKVPGALEISAAIRYALRAKEFSQEFRRFDGFIVLGCVIRGETSHYDLVCHEATHGVMELAREATLAVGFGLLTVENKEQAMARAAIDKGDQGGRAARACLQMIELKRQLKLFPR